MYKVGQCLWEMGLGSRAAELKLRPLIISELELLIQKQFSNEKGFPKRKGRGRFSSTSILYELYSRLIGSESLTWRARSQFYLISCRTIRENIGILLEGKNNGPSLFFSDNAEFWLSELGLPIHHESDLIRLLKILDDLDEFDPPITRLIELRVFGGLSLSESAEILNNSLQNLESEWAWALAWIQHHLSQDRRQLEA